MIMIMRRRRKGGGGGETPSTRISEIASQLVFHIDLPRGPFDVRLRLQQGACASRVCVCMCALERRACDEDDTHVVHNRVGEHEAILVVPRPLHVTYQLFATGRFIAVVDGWAGKVSAEQARAGGASHAPQVTATLNIAASLPTTQVRGRGQRNLKCEKACGTSSTSMAP
jgi:hypothetical protein